MKYLLLSLFTVFLSIEAEASTAKVFSFSSKVKNSQNTYSCSATLIKYKNQCHLLTNNHCVENKTDFKINFLKSSLIKNMPADDLIHSPTEQYAIRDNPSPISVELKKVNHRLDLAVLDFNSKEVEKECEDVAEVSLDMYIQGLDPSLVKIFVATGVINSLPVMNFTGNMSWATQGFGSAQVFSKYELGNDLYFFNVSDFDIIPGMSGSPILNTDNALIGIASKYVDFQNRALLVPLQMILKVIDNKIQDMPEMDLGNFKSNMSNAGNEHGGAGNEHGGAGNEHGGAGNEHAGAGGKPILSILSSFRAPDEGVLINNEIVLGFTSKDGVFSKTYYHQIDGRDEYQVKVNNPEYLKNINLKGKRGDFITRPTNGYPDIKLRQSLLERMDGFYYLDSPEADAAKPFNQKSSFFLPDPKSPKGLVTLESISTMLMLDLDFKKNKFIIESQYINFEFDINYSADYKQVFLTHKDLKLVCDNKHLLKLVCHADIMEISLSVNHTAAGREMKYRIAYPDFIKGKYAGIRYWFGAVSAAPNVQEWRKR